MLSTRIRLSGPLFSQGSGPMKEAAEEAVKDLTTEGEAQVKLQLYKGHGLQTGHYRRSIHGEVTKSMHGVVHDSRVVYGPWLEGVSSLNQRSRFKGYAMFRNACQQLNRLAGQILGKRIGEAARRLNGW